MHRYMHNNIKALKLRGIQNVTESQGKEYPKLCGGIKEGCKKEPINPIS